MGRDDGGGRKELGHTRNNAFIFYLVIIFSGDQQRKINTEHKIKVHVDVKLNETFKKE